MPRDRKKKSDTFYSDNRDFEAFYARRDAKKKGKKNPKLDGAPELKRARKKRDSVKPPKPPSIKEVVKDVRRRTAGNSKNTPVESTTAYPGVSIRKRTRTRRGMALKSATRAMIKSRTQSLQQMLDYEDTLNPSPSSGGTRPSPNEKTKLES